MTIHTTLFRRTVFGLVCTVIPVLAQESVVVNLYASPDVVKAGGTITVNVNFQTFPNLTRYGPIEIQFDPDIVSFLGAEKGSVMPSTFAVSNSASTSVITISGLDQTVEGAIAANQTAPTADELGNPIAPPADPSMHSDDTVNVCVLYFKVIETAPTGNAHFLLGNISGFKDSLGAQVIATAGSSATVPVESLLSSITSLSALSIDGVNFTQSFSPSIYEYEAHVSRLTENVIIIATTSDPAATVAITGQDNLQIGDNEAVVRVVAQDGKTAVEYKINIIRDETFVPEGAVISDNAGKLYSFAELPETMDLPLGFLQESQIIGTQTVPVFVREGIRSMLLYLKEEDKEPALYIYNPDTGTIRDFGVNSVLTQEAQLFVITAVPSGVSVPKGFSAGNVLAGEYSMSGYLSEDKTISLVYLTDEAGLSRFYVIDSKTGEVYPYQGVQKEAASFLIPFVIVSVFAAAELGMIAYIIYEIRSRNRPDELRRV